MATRFTRIFADATGTDPYSQTVSDAQQDLFLEAMFHGKAIYDVRALHDILGNRFPPETLLSHDLIEGAHAGVGLASDIQLFEQLPVDYGIFAARQHRWIRGDWQIARWTFGSVPAASGAHVSNPLSGINRWRIFDNLRRSFGAGGGAAAASAGLAHQGRAGSVEFGVSSGWQWPFRQSRPCSTDWRGEYRDRFNACRGRRMS